MKKILFWVLHRPDRSPSQRYRFEQYLDFLEANGYSYDYSYLIREEDDKVFYGKGQYWKKFLILWRSIWKRWRELKKAKEYDIVFVQRECFMLGTSFFERRTAKKTKLVFDFDDAIWLHVISANNRSLGWLKNGKKTSKIIEAAHLVLAGNSYLADYARQFNQNVKIIPTTINTNLHQPASDEKPEQAPVCIGWSGSFSTIEHFKYAEPALIQLKEKYGDQITFKVLGDPNYKNEKLGIQGIAWSSEREVPELQTMDIGIMPLPDDEWTKGKCGLKGLLYMAVGIPSVMADVGVNSEIVEDGVNGFLCDPNDSAEWIEKLSQLIEDAQLRRSMGAAGRQTVLERYSAISQQQRLLEALDGLLGPEM